MSAVTILYVVPEVASDRKALEAMCDQFGAEVSGDPELGGSIAEIEIEDSVDPLGDAEAFVGTLNTGGKPYFVMTASYTEPSRGIRYEAQLLSVDSTGEIRKTFPWSEGEPGFDERSLTLAGFTKEEADTILSRYLTSYGPKP